MPPRVTLRMALLDPRFVALALFAAVQASMLGCAPTLPELLPSVNPALAHAPLRTITLLPVDLTLDADDPPGTPSPEASYEGAVRALAALGPAVSKLAAERGLTVEPLAWDGTTESGGNRLQVLDPAGVANLADWLLGFTYAVLAHQASAFADTFVPPLPFATDATLFVGGYGHLFRDRPHRTQVARDVGIGIAVGIGIIAILLLALFSKGKVGFPRFGSGVGEAVLNALIFPAVIGVRLALEAPRTMVAGWLPMGHAHGPLCNPYLGVHAGVVVFAGRPRPFLGDEQRRANFLALGATLVDNKTGRVLWTAAQPMPIDPVDEQELLLAAAHLFEHFPERQ